MNPPFRTLSRAVSLALMAAAFATGPGVAAAQDIVEVHVSPQLLTLEVGQRQRLFLSAFYENGDLADRPVYQLASANTRVAKVDSDGAVVGVSPGQTTVRVTAGRGATVVRVVVGGGSTSPGGADTPMAVAANAPGGSGVDAGVSRVVVSPPPGPDPIPLSVGEAFRFRVRSLDYDSLDAPVPVFWSLSDSTVAQFEPTSGILTAARPGVTDLVARVPGLSDLKWRITVTPLELRLSPRHLVLTIGEERQLQASMTTEAGELVRPLTQGRWTSNGAAVSVDSTGRVRGLTFGRAEVRVAGPGDTASAIIHVVGDLLLSARGAVGDGAGLYQLQLDPLTLAPLLQDSASNLYASRSPSREAIVYASDADGLFRVYRMASDGTEAVRLTDAAGHQTQPVWTPDGRLLFTGTSGGQPQIFEMHADGSSPRQLTAGDTAHHSVAISRSGEEIAVVQGGAPEDRVVLLDRDGGMLLPANMAEEGRFERSPAFFPNGDLAAVVQIGAQASAVVRWDRDRDRRIPIITSDGTIRYFAISRDGRFVAAVVESPARNAGQDAELLLVDLVERRSAPIAVPIPPGTRLVSPSF